MTGTVQPDLYPVQDEGVPIEKITSAANQVLTSITPDQKSELLYPLNARKWRAWSNPEPLLRPFGLRLEELSQPQINSILSVIESSFSPEGYQKALAAMRINHFLGEIVKLPQIMNQHSYNFLIFGTPSSTQSWGWSLYGHHLCLNVFLHNRDGAHQIMIAPTFTGAEPNVIDAGPWSGTEILHHEGNLGLKLMQSLPSDLQQKAQIYKLMHDPAMLQTGDLKTDRWNKDDQRHLCGAFRDNRIVPYEGILVSQFPSSSSHDLRSLLLQICEQFLLYFPASSRAAKLKVIEKHFDKTYFSWIGGYGDDDAFYYRVQSPVVILEFDHHSGVFLANTEPRKFHTHTIVRMPNQGDYGVCWRKEHEKVQ